MNRTRLIFALMLGLLFAINCYATNWAFIGFDEFEQKMFAVVRTDEGEVYAYCYMDQSNPGGWIDPNYDSYGEADPDAVFETSMSPDDPDRLTDIPAGELNIITATMDLYDEN